MYSIECLVLYNKRPRQVTRRPELVTRHDIWGRLTNRGTCFSHLPKTWQSMYKSIFVTVRDYSSLFATIRHYSPLFVTIRYYSSLFATIRHYSPPLVTIRYYSSLFATIRHCSRLFATIRSIRWLFGFYNQPPSLATQGYLTVLISWSNTVLTGKFFRNSGFNDEVPN